MAASERNRKIFDEVLARYHQKQLLHTDPLKWAHEFRHPRDQEIVAWVAALMAYGQVKSIHAVMQKWLQRIDFKPAAFIAEHSEQEIRKASKGLYYRFYRDEDFAHLMIRMKQLNMNQQSLDAAFKKLNIKCPLEAGAYVRNMFRSKEPSAGQKFMFADTKASSAKRWHLFLRWMVRHDELDLGLYQSISKRDLIQPLDTHLFQIAKRFGLTKRKTPSLKAALEITEHFRNWCPDDPMKYDFALCHMGMTEGHKALK